MVPRSLETHPLPSRPVNAFQEFTSLRGPRTGGDDFDENAQIQLYVLCAKCKVLEEKLQKPEEFKEGFEKDENEELSLVYEHYETATLLRDSYKRGCHLCSLIWDSFVDRESEYDVPRLDSDEEWDRVKQAKLVLIMGVKDEDFTITASIHPEPPLTRPCIGIKIHIWRLSTEDTRTPIALSMPAVSTKAVTCRSFYRRCMEICDTTHTVCHLRRVENTPTRLLRVAAAPSGTIPNLQLVSPGDDGLKFPADTKFTALSYCWGTSPSLQLTTSNYRDLTTDIPFDRLPPTIQDSVLATIDLGIQYLWVDALCIIQDSPEDWNREAPKMYDIYQGCSVTLTASGASDSGGGFFAMRDPLRETPVLMDNWRAISEKQFLASSQPYTLDTRGWAMQEQLLSARNIQFGSYITWQCSELTLTEFGPPEYAFLGSEMVQELYSTVIRPERTDLFNILKTRILWHGVLNEYMEKKLTKKTDRLAAIMGLASAFQRRTGWRFIYGCWEPFMIQELLWHRMTHPAESTGLRPSWSWGSRDGDLYITAPGLINVRRDVADYIGTSCSVNGQTQFSSPPVLELSGVLFQAHKAELPWPKILDRHVRVEGWPDAITVEAQYDQKDRPWTDDQMLLPLSCDGKKDGIHTVQGLIIVPTDSGMFERVGFFEGSTPHGELWRPATFLKFLEASDGKPLVRQKILLI